MTNKTETLQFGYVNYLDGSHSEVPADQLYRLAYALCTLCLSPAIDHIHVAYLAKKTGEILWQHPSLRDVGGPKIEGHDT